MRLQALVIVAVAVLCTGDTQGQAAKEVERTKHAIQTAFNKGDVDTLKQLMTEDHVTILTYAHFSNAADQLKTLSDWKFSAYKIDGLKVKILTDDVALVSCRAAIQGTYQGKEVPSPVWVAEVWLKRNGRWVQASYQETPAGGAVSRDASRAAPPSDVIALLGKGLVMPSFLRDSSAAHLV
jgi:ketosteroid isomerase-like protein